MSVVRSSELPRLIQVGQIRDVRNHVFLGLVTNPILALTTAFVLWPVVDRGRLIGWTAAMLVVQLCRLVVHRRFERLDPGTEAFLRWGGYQTLGIAASGLVWGMSFVFIWPTGLPAYQMVLPIIVVGLGAGATSSYASVRSSFYWYVLLSHGPLIWRFLSVGTSIHTAIGLIGFLYVWALRRIGDTLLASFTEALELSQRLEERNVELSEALENVRTLKGLIPICAKCKSVRDDRGYWAQVEVYVTEHSDASFTHGICPTCEGEMRKELAAYTEGKR